MDFKGNGFRKKENQKKEFEWSSRPPSRDLMLYCRLFCWFSLPVLRRSLPRRRHFDSAQCDSGAQTDRSQDQIKLAGLNLTAGGSQC